MTNKLIKSFTLIIATLLIFSCEENNNPTSSQSDNKYEFDYVDNKKEINNHSYNEMTLYICGNNPDIETLKQFCSDKKESFSDGVFHIIVFFDKKENATFPSNPITGGYLNEVPSTHIKAIYTYNKLNGYSKLDYYDKNYWESKPKSVDIN